MTKKIIKDFSYPIEEFGKRIIIRKKDSVEGKFEFSAGVGLPSISYPTIKEIENIILVPNTIKSSLSDQDVIPQFVIFRTSENIYSIIVDVF